MSCPVKLQDLPVGVFEEVLTPERVRRHGRNSVTPLSFPKSRSALWDGTPAGDILHLQLCSRREPRLLLMQKALHLAQRHTRHSSKASVDCFFLGSLSVDSDEEGVTVTLDRFDPGRTRAGSSSRIPSALLPGDVLVPCLFSTRSDMASDAVVLSEADLHHCFMVLQQSVSGRQALDLSQLLKVKGRVLCRQQVDAAAFGLSWSAVFPSTSLDVEPIRPVPVIPTALLRSLTGVDRLAPRSVNHQRGFVTMDQTRKLLLLLESDPKACSLPLVGIWLSGVAHVYNPQVWVWCLRFLFGSALQDRVLSESGCFLLVVFASTHRAPQFFQCRGPGSGPLDWQLLSASQSFTLYQVVPADGQTLQCEMTSEHRSAQMQVFRSAQSSFNSAASQVAGLSVSDHDSGVEDEDLSPRPSPSPHLLAQQTPRVQPTVPELSLLIDSSFFSSNQNAQHNVGSTLSPPPLPCMADVKSAPPTGNTSSSSSSAPQTAATPLHLHSTPNSNLQPCACCSSRPYDCTAILPPAAPPPAHSLHPTMPLYHHPVPPSSPPSFHHHPRPLPAIAPPPLLPCSHPATIPCCDDAASPHPSCMSEQQVVPAATYQLLLRQDQQLRLLQAQVKMLLEAQGRLQSSSRKVDAQNTRSTASVAVETGASLFLADSAHALPNPEVQDPPPSSPKLSFSHRAPLGSPTSSLPSSSSCDLSISRPVGTSEEGDIQDQEVSCPPSSQNSSDSVQSPDGGEKGPADERLSFYQSLLTQLTSRLQESDSRQEVESRSVVSDSSQSSQRKLQSGEEDPVVSATVRQLQQLGVPVNHQDVIESDRRISKTVESSSTLACINPTAVLSRLSAPECTSVLIPGGSVDLSLEANAIALRYLSDSQLSRLSLGGHAPPIGHASATGSLLSPSNMSLATRKYMRRYGLIEEEDCKEDDGVHQVSGRQPLSETLNLKLLPQSQLIQDLRPKMQLLAEGAKPNSDKENRPGRRPSLVRASSHQTQGSLGNILDLSRLRQLPKLF